MDLYLKKVFEMQRGQKRKKVLDWETRQACLIEKVLREHVINNVLQDDLNLRQEFLCTEFLPYVLLCVVLDYVGSEHQLRMAFLTFMDKLLHCYPPYFYSDFWNLFDHVTSTRTFLQDSFTLQRFGYLLQIDLWGDVYFHQEREDQWTWEVYKISDALYSGDIIQEGYPGDIKLIPSTEVLESCRDAYVKQWGSEEKYREEMIQQGQVKDSRRRIGNVYSYIFMPKMKKNNCMYPSSYMPNFYILLK